MTARRDRRWSLAVLLLSIFACADSAPSSSGSDGTEAVVDEDSPQAATRAFVAQTASDGAADEAGSAPVVIPPPVTAPLIWGFGIGITDVPAAVKFYTEVMKMTVEKEGVKRDDRTETILYASQAKKGARLVLMNFDDKRNTRKITTKLVFQAQSASAVNSAAAKHPDYKSRMNLGIVQFDGPETYVHEVGGIFDTSGGGIKVPYPIAMGFSTSNLAASRRFYTSLGMKESRLGSFRVTDATGSSSITEYSAKFPDGAGIVLQEWASKRNSKDNPVKVVLLVPDAKAVADKVVAGGGSIVKEAERLPIYDNRLVIVAKDLDGYLIELVQ